MQPQMRCSCSFRTPAWLGGAAVLVCVCAAAVLLAAAGTEGNRASSAHALLESNDDAPWSRPVGKGDYWLAKEDSMELDAADALARRSLRRSKQMLQESGSRGRTADRGLGDGMRGLREQSTAAKLRLAADNDRAQIERSRAHLLRMQASDDTAIAQSDLDKVTDLDKQLASIKQQAVASRAGFGSASHVILGASEYRRKLQEDAARVTQKIKAMRAKITQLVAQGQADKTAAAEDKDKEDVAQEDLSAALVRRSRREKRVEEQRRRLDRMEIKFAAADKLAAAKLTKAQLEYKGAKADLGKLQNNLHIKHAPAHVHKRVKKAKHAH